MRRFGMDARTLIIALRGGWPQRVDKSWFGYPSWREMSQLEHVAGANIVVVMPDDALPLYRPEAVTKIKAIIDAEKPDKAYCFAFSKNASCFVETLSKHVQFDGAVICSGVNPPTECDPTPRLGVDSLVIYGAHERGGPFDLISNAKTAKEIHATFSELGRCELWEHPGGHAWPADWNSLILSHFNIAA